MQKEDSIYLEHIMQCINKIEQYTHDVSYDAFCKSTLVQDAVIRQIEIIGEATKMLSKSFTQQYAHINWKDMAGMRDKLIHNYLGVDIDVIWQTLLDDIPPLKKEVMAILKH